MGRQRRPNYTALLPVEIWRECFMLLGITEHKKLAKACHFFHDISLPFIFKSITFSSRIAFYKHEEAQEMTTQLEKLAEDIRRFTNLAKSPRYAPLVRKCTLRYSLRFSSGTDESIAKLGKDAYDPFIQAFVAFIPSFVMLREIEIDFMTKMDKRILTALTTLPQLERLSLPSVRFGVHQLKPLIKVRELSINNSVGSDCNPNRIAKRLDLFSAEHLEQLCVLSRVYSPKIFLALTNRGPSQNLTRLTFYLDSKDMALLCPFLATCPKLEFIHLDYTFHDIASLISFPKLPRSTIPLLQSFIGPDTAAMTFVPGRPVKKVRLEQNDGRITRNYSEIEIILPHLSRSTGPIIDLDIEDMECGPELMALISTHLPNLTQLKLMLGNRRMFPEEDPHSTQLELVVANEAGKATDVLLPVHAHAIYMSLLHWTVLGRIHLPPCLETIYLLDRFYYFFGTDHKLDSELNEKPYTSATAQSIFDALSAQYPALKQIFIGEARDRIEWNKNPTGKWALSQCRR